MRDKEWREKVDEAMVRVISEVKDICPEAEISLGPTMVEDYDFKVRVVVPDGTSDEVFDALEHAVYVIEEEMGVNIWLCIYERSEYEGAKARD